MMRPARFAAASSTLILAGSLTLAVPTWAGSTAVEVVSFAPGVGGALGFDNPAAALGEPTRFTSPGTFFGGAVTPFQPAFSTGEIVSIGESGQITLRLAEPAVDAPEHAFGIDLLVFGNAFLTLGGSGFPEGGVIELSVDGITFFVVPGVDADGMFPTLGYADLTEPFATTPGSVETDFFKAADPSLNLASMSLEQISLAYDGSGGGVGIDLAAAGLAQASYIRISNPIGSGLSPEIDAVTVIPTLPPPVPGDVNADGTVNAIDLGFLASNFVPEQGGKSHAQGDLNADGFVDVADFGILAFNFIPGSNTPATSSLKNVTTAPSAVPEPATAWVMCIAGAPLLTRRRR